MKKVLISFLAIFIIISGHAQITVTVGSALQQNPGTDIHLPVIVRGLNGTQRGVGITGIELHINYTNTCVVYDTTLYFSNLTPVTQWYFSGNGIEYATNWLEPSGNKLNIPDNTVLFEVAFHYLGGSTELTFDTARCLLIDSAYNLIQGVTYVNGQITPSQGSQDSRWNGIGPWNTIANWSNGIPGDVTNAVIETGDVTVGSNAICNSLTINQACSLKVSPNYSLTVNNNYTNNGTFELQSDVTGTGSIIVNGAVSGTGSNNFGRHIGFDSGYPALVASPVSGAIASVFESNILEKYNEGSASWAIIPSTENLENGKGYRVNGSSPATFSFQGLFTTSDINLSNLAFTGSGQVENQGLNLLGNPYPSAIQWEQGSWNRTNLDYAVYAWSGYKFVSWNGTIGALKDGIIPAMQGFFVKSNAAGGSLTIPAGSRLHETQPFYKNTASVSNMLTMKIESITDTNHYDETFVHILSGSSAGFDQVNDAVKLLGNTNYPQIYTKASDQRMLSINTQPDYSSVPLECIPGVAGSYKITFGNIDSYNPTQSLFFEDKTMNSSINIRNTNEFVFASTGTTESGRFFLHFHPVGIEKPNTASFIAWVSDHVIHINTTTGNVLIERMEIFSLTGQSEYSTGNFSLPAIIPMDNLNNGLYILRITTREGSYTQKLLVR